MGVSANRFAVGSIVGLVSAGVALAVGELAAVFVRPAAAPIIAVGNRFILLTPETVKRWAIRQFGTQDKHALLTGIYVVIGLLAVVIGVLAMRWLLAGVAGIAIMGAVGGYSALTARAHHTSDVVPSILGALAGIVALWMLERGAVDLDGPEPAVPANSPAYSQPAPQAPPAVAANRRRFLQTSAAAAGFAVAAGFGGRAWQRKRFNAAAARKAVVLPSPMPSERVAATNFDLGKSGVPFLTANADFYRIDTALTVPQIDPSSWKLRIHGKVAKALTLTYADLLARPQVERWITLACVSNEIGGNLISTARFQGVLLADVLREAGVAEDADQLVASSSDGMTIGSPTKVVMDGRDSMLAVGMNGVPLPTAHGFPVRMVVPGLYGYVSACKWIVDLRATTFADYSAYWVRGGWAALGPVKLASRIDTPRNRAVVSVGTAVPIAGVAWDQHVGVSAVEVQIDNDDWQQAQLASVPSTDTWRQWVYLWSATPGTHLVRVRAFDAAGNPQISTAADPFPSGATGLHTVAVRVHA